MLCKSCQRTWEDRCKFDAKIAIADGRPMITIPTRMEWIGLGMLERDDEMPNINSYRAYTIIEK